MPLLKDLLGSLFGPKENNNPKPEIERTKKEASFVGDAVNSYIGEHAKDGARLPLDGKYYAASQEDVKSIVQWNYSNRESYKKAEYDCENFALSFMADVQKEFGVTAVGLVIDWSGKHAYNMFVYEDGSVELFEPQTDTFVEPGEKDKFAFERVRVII